MAPNLQWIRLMWLIIFIISAFLLFIHSYVHNFLANVILGAHQICLDFSPPSPTYKSFYSAMICGEQLHLSDFSQDMRTVGLYHLLVVSGSHFIFLEQLLTKIFFKLGQLKNPIIFVFLTIFALACQLSPPVTRAWLSFVIRKASQEHRLYWIEFHITVVSGLTCLLIFPEWLQSLSFELSWAASLFISIPTKSSVRQHALVYLGLAPVLIGMQPQHPASILINWLLAPLLGVVLLPLCVLAMALPFLTPLSDCLWLGIEQLCHILSRYMQNPSRSIQSHHLQIWIYLFIAHGWIYFWLRNKKRKTL